MKTDDVKVVSLKKARVAAALGFGESPEHEAWEKITQWAEGKCDLESPDTRNFGFNNPDPSPGSPNYGYEVWLTVDDDVVGNDDVTIKEMPGGLYAVTHLHGLERIGEAWKQLVVWRQSVGYLAGHHQWLEELISSPQAPPEELEFNLYLPIRESGEEMGAHS